MIVGYAVIRNGIKKIQPIAYPREYGVSQTSGTLIFQGYKTSLLNFLLDDSRTKMDIVSSSGEIFVTIGKQLDKPAVMVVQGATRALAATAGSVHTLGSEIGEVVHTIMEKSLDEAEELSDKVPGKAAALFDRTFKKRLIVEVEAYHSQIPTHPDSISATIQFHMQRMTLGQLAQVILHE